MKSPLGGPVMECAQRRVTSWAWGVREASEDLRPELYTGVWPGVELEWWGVERAKPERAGRLDLEGRWVQAGNWGFIQEEGKGAPHKGLLRTLRAGSLDVT